MHILFKATNVLTFRLNVYSVYELSQNLKRSRNAAILDNHKRLLSRLLKPASVWECHLSASPCAIKSSDVFPSVISTSTNSAKTNSSSD